MVSDLTMERWYRCILLILLYFGSLTCFAQSKSLHLRHYTNEEGLSYNRVNDIIRDENGFIWIATSKGLNRFDGYEFKVFSHSEKANSLSNNIVNNIFKYKKNVFLISTNEGFNIFKSDVEEFYGYYHNTKTPNCLPDDIVNLVYIDKDGVVWVGTAKGFARVDIDMSTKKPTIKFIKQFDFIDNDHPVIKDDIFSILKDINGNLWIGTRRNGLYKIDTGKQTIKNYKFVNNWGDVDIEANRINSILQDEEFNIWVGTGSGLNIINSKDDKITNYPNLSGDPDNNLGSSIQNIYQDKDGNLWFCTYNGLAWYDKENNNFILHISKISDSYGLNNNFINTIYDDGLGTLWIGTEYGGISIIDRNTKKFHTIQHEINNPKTISGNTINAIGKDNNGGLWIGTSGQGLNYIDPKTKNVTIYTNNPDNPHSISGDVISDIYQDSNNKVWIATWGWGLNRIDSAKNGNIFFTRFFPIPYNFISGIKEDFMGRLWVSTSEGVLVKENNNPKFELLKLQGEGVIQPTLTGAINVNKKGDVYIPTDLEGLYIINHNANFQKQVYPGPSDFLIFNHERINTNSIPDNLLFTFFDKQQNVWIGTRGSGLVNMVDTTYSNGTMGVEFIKYTENDGLCDNIILSIQEDDSSNLWISTPNGISRFNKLSKKFTNFYRNDGLSTNEFFWFAGFKSDDGTIYFGSVKGVNYFHPDSIKMNQKIPNVAITEFKIMNRIVSIGEKIGKRVLLTKDISNTKSLVLSHKDYIFSFKFTAFNYSIPERNNYAYKLEGFDADWIYTDAGNRIARYTNIPGGNYIFKVKASNNDGVWNEEGISISIRILPPWWRTWYFKLGLFIIISSFVVGYFMYILKKEKKQKVLLEKEVEKRTIDLNKANKELAMQTVMLQETNVELEERQQQITEQAEELKVQAEELNSKNAKLEGLNATKDKFFSIIAHDLKNPFNSILGFCQMFLNRFDNINDEKKISYVKSIQSSTGNIYKLLENLLAWARSQTGNMELKFKKVDVKNIVETNAKIHENSAKLKNTIIKTDVEPNTFVVSDENVLNTVLRNLISNAVKYTKNGFIAIVVIKNENEILFEVKDTGVGMDEYSVKTIFDIRQSKSKSGTNGEEGTGLGLILCKEFIERCNGKVWCKSRIGKGTSFYFSLPN